MTQSNTTRLTVIVIALLFSMIVGCAGQATTPDLTIKWQRMITHENLKQAIGVAVTEKTITVSDPKSAALLRFNDDGQLLATWPIGEAHNARPMHIAEDQRGRVYVPDHLNDHVTVFDANGNNVLQFGEHGNKPGQFDSPAGVAVSDDGSIYVADFNNHRVQRFGADGHFIRTWGEKGRVSAGNFDYPTDVAIGSRGHIYVADAYNHRVQKFKSNGEHVLSFGTKGSEQGEFNVAIGLTVDGQGRVFVADQFNDRVQIFTSHGEFITAFGATGAGSGQFDRPNDVAISHGNHVYIADFGNGRVQRFEVEQHNASREKAAWKQNNRFNTSLGRWWY